MGDEPYLTPWKRFPIPVYGAVDITGYEGLVNALSFQRLRFVRQLATAFLTYPGATHTRFEHSLGALAQAREYVRPLMRKGELSEDDATAVEIAALLHDVGHGPFSHLVENVAKKYGSKFSSHNERTDYLIESQFSHAIDEVSSSELVRAIVSKQHPLSQFVSHKTLGADKVAYVRVDRHHAWHPLNPLNIGDLAENLIFVDGVFGVDERMARDVMKIQRHYFDMYTEVYFDKGVQTSERFVERSLQFAAENELIDLDEMWRWSDGTLVRELSDADGRFSEDALATYWNYRITVALHVPNHEATEVIRDKRIVSLPIKSDDFFKWYANVGHVRDAEVAVANLLSIPEDDVLFTYSADPKRLVPDDVVLFSPSGKQLGTLFGLYPDHKRSLEELARSSAACRVCVKTPHRQVAYDRAEEISAVVHGLVQKI